MSAVAAFGSIWVFSLYLGEFLPLLWRTIPGFLKRQLLLLVPFLGAMFVAGSLDHEARIFTEMIPVAFAAFLVGLVLASRRGTD